jgi:hypothetical protein
VWCERSLVTPSCVMLSLSTQTREMLRCVRGELGAVGANRFGRGERDEACGRRWRQREEMQAAAGEAAADALRDAGRVVVDVMQRLHERGDALDQALAVQPAPDAGGDVLLFSGSLGIADESQTCFIYDCGYNLGFLKAKMTTKVGTTLALHPTLLSLV